MQTEVVDKVKARQHFQNSTSDNNEVDIINSVTKLGKTISHTRTDFRCAKTQELIAFSSHVKYMPTGSPFMALLFRNRFLNEWFIWYSLRGAKIREYEEKNLFGDVLLSNLDYSIGGATTDPSEGSHLQATFNVTKEHTNAFGGLHGGCHAMVMEQVGSSFAQRKLDSKEVLLEAMQVEYIGAGQLGPVDVYCETIGEPAFQDGAGYSLHVRVLLKQQKSGRICSEGKLRFGSF